MILPIIKSIKNIGLEAIIVDKSLKLQETAELHGKYSALSNLAKELDCQKTNLPNLNENIINNFIFYSRNRFMHFVQQLF